MLGFYLIERVTNDFLIFNRLDKNSNKQIELFIEKKRKLRKDPGSILHRDRV